MIHLIHHLQQQVLSTVLFHYDLRLVVLSVIAALFAAYTTLEMSEQVTVAEQGKAKIAWLVGGAVAMGTGIWCMHFLGMLALQLEIEIHYDFLLVFLSILVAIASSGLALFTASHPTIEVKQLLSSSAIMGIGIASMHYIGMAAMQMPASTHYNLALVALSVAIAIAVSLLALYLLSYAKRTNSQKQYWTKLGSAIALGLAIPLMHYTGMAATTFVSDSRVDIKLFSKLDTLLPATVTIATFLILGLALLTAFFERRLIHEILKAGLIQASESELQQLLQDIHVGVVVVGARSEIVRANQEALSKLRVSSYELLEDGSLPSGYRVVREDGQPLPNYLWAATEAIATRQPVQNLVMGVYCEKEQNPTWLLVNAKPQFAYNGAVRQVICTFTDISSQVSTEIALRESEAKFRSFVENANDVIYTLNLDGTFSYVSPNWTNILGHITAEVIGSSLVPMIHPDDLPSCLEVLEKVVSTGDHYNDIRYRILHKDGDWRWHTSSLAPLKNSEGNILSIIGICRDIGTQIAAAEILQKAKDEADMASRAKGEFLANMSHELRTPLNAILGFAQLMTSDSSLTSEHRDRLKIISNSGTHLLALINDILEISKIEAGKITLYETTFNLTYLLSNLKEMLQLRAESKGLQLALEQSKNVPEYIHADEKKLRQVLLNLLSNAVKFTSKGSVTLRVFMSDQRSAVSGQQSESGQQEERDESRKLIADSSSDSFLHFEIEDTGVGIAAHELGDLFKSFMQTDSGRRSQDGTGLGLAISQKYINLMGGDIQVKSVIGQGTTFFFDMQLKQVLDAAAEVDRQLEQLEHLEQKKNRSLRILLAEDNPINKRVALEMLRQLGYRADTVVNGVEAIAALRRHPYDLIFMDVQMPEMDGLIASQKICEEWQPSDRPVIIALTANAMQEDRDRCLAAGMNDHLSKPVRLGELKSLLAQWSVIIQRQRSLKRLQADGYNPKNVASSM